MSEHIIVYTDGGARGNPGPAAYGVYITDSHGKELAGFGEAIGHATNNIAEYTAVVKAFEWIVSQSFPNGTTVLFRFDSQLVCNQLLGLYKVKNKELLLLYQKIKLMEHALRQQGLRFTYTHVPRAQNTEADRLVNLALDK